MSSTNFTWSIFEYLDPYLRQFWTLFFLLHKRINRIPPTPYSDHPNQINKQKTTLNPYLCEWSSLSVPVVVLFCWLRGVGMGGAGLLFPFLPLAWPGWLKLLSSDFTADTSRVSSTLVGVKPALCQRCFSELSVSKKE